MAGDFDHAICTQRQAELAVAGGSIVVSVNQDPYRVLAAVNRKWCRLLVAASGSGRCVRAASTLCWNRTCLCGGNGDAVENLALNLQVEECLLSLRGDSILPQVNMRICSVKVVALPHYGIPVIELTIDHHADTAVV